MLDASNKVQKKLLQWPGSLEITRKPDMWVLVAKCPVTRAGSNGRCNTIWYKAAFKGGVYETRDAVWVFGGAETRRVASLEGRADAAEIGRAFGKEHSSIRCLVSRHGGIAPAVRRWKRPCSRAGTLRWLMGQEPFGFSIDWSIRTKYSRKSVKL